MRTTSNVIPKNYEIERVNDQLCNVLFATNIIEAECEPVVEDDTENKTENPDVQYTYDLYTLAMPYSDTLSERIDENYQAWLDMAQEQELKKLVAEKLQHINDVCQKKIYAGVNVETKYGMEHFSLSIRDQQNLSAIQMFLASGVSAYPYHADGKSCVLYSAKDLSNIIATATKHITYHTTYCNLLRVWVNRETDSEAIRNIVYGCDLPDDLKKHMADLL